MATKRTPTKSPSKSPATKRPRKQEEVTFSNHENFNKDITDILEEIGQYEKNQRQIHKFTAYQKAVKALKAHPTRIKSGAEAKKLPGVGEKIAAKIDEIRSTGSLKKLQQIRGDDEEQAVALLARVHGIGPVAARNFVKAGITTLDQLSKVSTLTSAQKIGVKYFHELEERIPRDEMEKLKTRAFDLIGRVDKEIVAEVCGSFRRGKPESGDMDVLLMHPSYRADDAKSVEGKRVRQTLLEDITKALQRDGFVTDVLSRGEVKMMGVCRLAPSDGIDYKHRRIDLRLIPADQYPCALLYFTGSDFFNKQMRSMALERGFTLNEYSIRPIGSTGVVGEPIPVESERDVFDAVGMEYKEPWERDL